MSFIDPDAIPGYRAAVIAEQTDRDLALLETIPICGLPCRQISLRVWMILNQCGNAFIVGGRPATPEEVAVFLWFLSPSYCLSEKERQKFVKRKVLPLFRAGKLAWCVAEICVHLRRAFRDAPGGGGNRKEYVNPCAAVIDSIASEYGWTADYIMALPIAALFLYQRAARMRHNPKAVMFNESDEFLSLHLRQRMEQQQNPPVGNGEN